MVEIVTQECASAGSRSEAAAASSRRQKARCAAAGEANGSEGCQSVLHRRETVDLRQ
jgi:hypothetical protein